MHIPADTRKKLYAFLPYLALIAVWAIMPALVSTRFWLNVFMLVFVRVIGAVSLRTVWLAGVPSFAQSAFVGVGAYTAAVLATNFGLPAYATIPLGGLAAMVIGVLTGLPFVRLKSVYYVMASMFLGISIIYVFSSLEITGRIIGIVSIPGFLPNIRAYYYFFLILAVVCCACMYRFEHSRIGMTLRAIAQSEDAAGAMGVSKVYFKSLAFGFGYFFAGIAGASFALYNGSASPKEFGILTTLWFLMYVLVGGQDKFIGPIIGTIILVILPQASRVVGEWAPIVTSIAMIAIAYLLIGGLASIPEKIKNAFAGRRRGRGGADMGSPEADS
ncbi:MAG: branched-chain amino acid ABC transporter permease [Clostridiales bacterium]|nr:branched-chain amino acid ABC transporter permease [Clostridiales bacterium]